MADITMTADPIVAAIYTQYQIKNRMEAPRGHLGASIIGKECKRAIWFDFRWATREDHEGRLLRLFETGHLAEDRFVANLRSIGAEVYDREPSTGRQFHFNDSTGHFSGSMDGCARKIPGAEKTWHVVEFKTHGAKSFASLRKEGVQKSKPQHYAQMQVYMGWSGMTRALYLAVNKDTDELYSERFTFDPAEFAKLEAKAHSIIFTHDLPARISDDAGWYQCKLCSHHAVCHVGRVPATSCRTCCHSTPEREPDAEGKPRWTCAIAKQDIPTDVQRTGCGQHLVLPPLVQYAAPVDAGEGWILFKRHDTGVHFVVAAMDIEPPQELMNELHPAIYRSTELAAATDHRAIGNVDVDELKGKFNAKVIA